MRSTQLFRFWRHLWNVMGCALPVCIQHSFWMRPWLSKSVQHWKQDEGFYWKAECYAKRFQSRADLFTRMICNHSRNFFSSPVQVAQAEVLLTRIWGFQSLTWETNILKVWHLFFLYKSFWKQCSTIQGRGMRTKGCDLFLSFALLPASNMLGRWSIDGVFTMRRIPREHQVRFRVWAQGPKYDSPLIGIETLCSVIYVTRRQPCKDRPILENTPWFDSSHSDGLCSCRNGLRRSRSKQSRPFSQQF